MTMTLETLCAWVQGDECADTPTSTLVAAIEAAIRERDELRHDHDNALISLQEEHEWKAERDRADKAEMLAERLAEALRNARGFVLHFGDEPARVCIAEMDAALAEQESPNE